MRQMLPSLWGDHSETERTFRPLHDEVDKLFEGFGKGFRLPAFADASKHMMPQVDVVETDNAIKVTAELPGVDQKDIDVTVSDNLLTIKAEEKSEKEDKEKNYYMMERSYGTFQRTLRIPFDVQSGEIDAKIRKGCAESVFCQSLLR